MTFVKCRITDSDFCVHHVFFVRYAISRAYFHLFDSQSYATQNYIGTIFKTFGKKIGSAKFRHKCCTNED
jgi:hypothetical protein